LAAPSQPKLLAAPKIAGLLPATIPVCEPAVRVKVEIVREVPATLEELFERLGPIRSQEEMDAEMVEFLLGAEERMQRRFGQPLGLLTHWESLGGVA
jgi:hypothetical protein